MRIEELRVGPYGWTWAGSTPLNASLNEALGLANEKSKLLLWELDPDAGVALSEHGHRVSIQPFPGTIGLCPGGSGVHESWHPSRTGGNMDCTQMRVGSDLYFPVEVEGGLLSLGDAHAAQSDGELTGSAIECMMERIVLRVAKAEDVAADGPTVRHPDGSWATLGFGESLDDALVTAASNMLTLMQRLFDCPRQDAMLLTSTHVDLRISQVVNGVRGVHAVLTPPRTATSR